MSRAQPSQDFAEAIHEVVHTFGVQRLASLLGMPQSTLYNKANLHDGNAQFTVPELAQISLMTGDLRAVHALCRGLSGAFVSLPDLSHLTDNALLDIVMRINAEGGDVFRVLTAALEKDGIDHKEQRAIDTEIDHVIAAYLELQARTRFMSGTN